MTKRKNPDGTLARKVLKPDPAVLRRQCEEDHLLMEDLTRLYGYSDVSNLYVYCRKWGITPYRTPRATDYLREMDLSPEQHQVVTGTLFGDGSIRLHRTNISRHTGQRYERQNQGGQLVIAQGQRQRDYLEWKKRWLEPFITATEPYAHAQGGFGIGGTLYSYYTVTHPAFAEYRRLFYPDGIKRITEASLAKLGPLGIAVWLMDDGSYVRQNGYIAICTNSERHEDLEVAAAWFGRLLGKEPYIHHAGRPGQFHLRFNRLAANALRDLVHEHFFGPLLYKLGR